MPYYTTSSFSIHRILNGKDSTLINQALDTSNMGANRPTPAFDGMVISVINDTTILPIADKTNWLTGNSNLDLAVSADAYKAEAYHGQMIIR